MPLIKFSKNKEQNLQKDKEQKLQKKIKYSFFPGCSLKTSGNENTLSLLNFCDKVNIELLELEDWNCCGSSSAHSVDHDVAVNLPLRNISLVPKNTPLLIACPSCLIRMKQAHLNLKKDKQLRSKYEQDWGVPFDFDLKIVHFFEIFNEITLLDYIENAHNKLNQIKIAPYYGCMLSMPPDLRFEPNYHGIMEKILTELGADMISFGQGTKCCGSYLSVAKPKLVEKIINEIVSNAIEAGAECLVTACSMCHLNIEIRCTVKNPIPTLHFSELLAMALGVENQQKWFPRHIIDPIPLLKRRNLFK